MRKGTLTREEAIQQAGIAAVAAVEALDCDYTNRVQTDGDDAVEFAASVPFGETKEAYPHTLIAYYYQDPADLEDCDDLSSLDWTIAGYGVQ